MSVRFGMSRPGPANPGGTLPIRGLIGFGQDFLIDLGSRDNHKAAAWYSDCRANLLSVRKLLVVTDQTLLKAVEETGCHPYSGIGCPGLSVTSPYFG